MSAFGIFALILTTAYIIYFLVMIARDVATSRKTADENSEVETFDTSFVEEKSVEVKETEGGFAVGDNEVVSTTVKATEKLEPEASPLQDTVDKLSTIKDKVSTEAMPLDVKDVYETVQTHEEYYDTIQDPFHQIDNANVMVKRVPAGEPTQESSGNAQGRDNL